MHNVQLQNVEAPTLLKNLKGWLVWRYESPTGSKKPLKVPYYINGHRRSGTNGSKEDTAALSTFDEAKQCAITGSYTGVGLALLPEFGITALDFDNVVDDITGDINPEIIEGITNTYYEYSPSGLGIRAFVLGELGDKKSPSKQGQFGFELFNNKGFVTFTGNSINDTSITPPSQHILNLITSRWPIPSEPRIDITSTDDPIPLKELEQILSHLDSDCSYHEWLHIGMAIHFEAQGTEEGFNIWDHWSATSTKYNTKESNYQKWESFGNHLDVRPITGRTLIKMAQDNGYNPNTISIDFQPITDDIETLQQSSGHYNIRTAEQYGDQIQPISWLIKGFLPKANLGVLYGESGSGKSFIALDVCAALSRGIRWNDLRPPKSAHRILYVVAEGAAGFINRLHAYCKFQSINLSDLNIDIISDVIPNLVDKTSVKHLIEDIKNRQPYDLIVLDTFAQVTPGANENSGEDMGKALDYCRQISRHTNAMILLIHHSGKDASKGARGWSGLRAAADVVLEITRDVANGRKIRVEKQKDGIDGAEFGFKLNNIILDHDEDGDPISSCVIEYCEPPKILPKLKENQQLIVDTLNHFELYEWVTQDHLLSLCLEKRGIKEGEELKYIRSNIKKTITNSIDKTLQIDDDYNVKLLSVWHE